MSKSKITLALVALGLSLGAATAPALAERAEHPRDLAQKAVKVVKPAVAGFVATGSSGYTRQLWKSEPYRNAGNRR